MTSKLTSKILDDETLAELIAFRRSRVEYCQKEGLPYQKALHDSMMLALEELQERRKADNEPVAEVVSIYGDHEAFGEREIRPLVGIQQMPYGTKLYRHAQPAPVVEREPIAWLNDAYLARGVVDGEAGSEDAGPGYIPVYREAGPQPAPAVPDDVLDALQKVARIRLDMNDFDGDRRGIADCLGDTEEALIEVVNRCAAMLAAAPQPQNAPQNIPEIIPNELIAAVNRLLDSNGSRGCYSLIKCYDAHIEVERLLAAARQEVKP